MHTYYLDKILKLQYKVTVEITMHMSKMGGKNLNFKEKTKYKAKGNKSKEMSTIEVSTLI